MLGRYNLACCSYLRHKHKLSILSRLRDLKIGSECFNIQNKGTL